MHTDREAVQELDAKLKEERKRTGEKVGLFLMNKILIVASHTGAQHYKCRHKRSRSSPQVHAQLKK